MSPPRSPVQAAVRPAPSGRTFQREGTQRAQGCSPAQSGQGAGVGGQGRANAGQKEAGTHPAAWTRREHSLPRERSQARKEGRVLHDSIYRKCPE